MITIDATALTLDSFHLSGIGILETGTPQVLTLAPGTYRFGTLFGPSFEFFVTEADTVGYNADLTFLEGVDTNTLSNCQEITLRFGSVGPSGRLRTDRPEREFVS